MEGLLQAVAQFWASLIGSLAFDPALLGEPDMIVRLLLQVLLLAGSAFFSGSETALFSLSRLDLQKLRKERNPHSETLHALLDQPRRLIISILCGNELINIAAAANMTSILVSLYGEAMAALVNVLIMVPLLLLVGEVTPKTIAVSNPLGFSTGIVASPMKRWVQFIGPLRGVIRAGSDRITTFIVGEDTAAENILQVDEFRTLVAEVAEEGEINATERALIYNLLEAGDTEIVEIMTPRTRTAFINGEQSVPIMVEQFKACRHSRIPVFQEHRDNLIGFMHAEDVLQLIFKGVELDSLNQEDILRPPVVVPLTKKVDEMFDFFQHNRARAAAVLNEFGGVEGFITIQDVLNFIFGQIAGDVKGQELYQERDQNVYEVPGDMRLNDFNNLANFGIEDPRMTTVAGVAFRHLDRLPKTGDQVSIDGIVVTVLEMDGHRIAKVRVARGATAEESMEGGFEEAAVGGEPALDAADSENGRDIEPPSEVISAESGKISRELPVGTEQDEADGRESSKISRLADRAGLVGVRRTKS